MTTFSMSILLARLASAAEMAFAAVVRFAASLENRRAASKLAEFDMRMLKDLGLTSSDLRDAFSEPVWRDPTTVLAARVRERRVYGRRQRVISVQSPPVAPEIDAPA